MSRENMLREVEAHLLEQADFNRSWTDGRRGAGRKEHPGYYRRRIEIAEQLEGWAGAVRDAREALVR